MLLAAVGADEEFQPFLRQFGKPGILQVQDPFINEIEIGINLIG